MDIFETRFEFSHLQYRLVSTLKWCQECISVAVVTLWLACSSCCLSVMFEWGLRGS